MAPTGRSDEQLRTGAELAGAARAIAEREHFAAALHILKGHRPDVAVLDISLRGRELVTPVAEALHRLKVPFVVASAHPIGHIFKGAEVLAEAPAVGKPTDTRRLLLTLAQLLPGQQIGSPDGP